jgi:hypothetical protein
MKLALFDMSILRSIRSFGSLINIKESTTENKLRIARGKTRNSSGKRLDQTTLSRRPRVVPTLNNIDNREKATAQHGFVCVSIINRFQGVTGAEDTRDKAM